MLPVSTRIKLKRDSFKLDNKLEANKRRWAGAKSVCGLNPLADQVQDRLSSPADVVSPGRGDIASAGFDGASAQDGGGGAAGDPGTSPSTVSRGGAAKARGACTRSQPVSKEQLSEHKNEIFYRLRLALCFAREKLRNGGKRARRGSPEAHALSCVESTASIESGAVSIEQTPPQQPRYNPDTGAPGPEQPRRGRGRPRKLFGNRFRRSDGRVKTTTETEVRSKARRSISGRAANFSSKVQPRRCLRSDTRKPCKRLVKNACCALCGDVKFAARPIENLARLHSRRARAGRPGHKGGAHVPESHRTPNTRAARCQKTPTVKLCDVGRVFAIASRDFSCVLPAVRRLKGKRRNACCLKKEFGFLVHPRLHGTEKHTSNIQSWEIPTPTHGCASLPSGDAPCGAAAGTCVSDTAQIPDGSVTECVAHLGMDPDCEGMRQTDAEGKPSPCEDDDPAACLCEKPKACPVENSSERGSSPERRVPPLVLRRVSSDGVSVRSEDNDHSPEEREGDDGRSEGSDGELHSPECLSCQRTQAYAFLPRSSCARTSISWPFPRRGPPDELRSSRPGRRWIDAPCSPAACSSDKDVQNQQSESNRKALERRTAEPDPKNRKGSLIWAADDSTHKSKMNPTKKTPNGMLERTLKALVNRPRVLLSRVSALESRECPKASAKSCERKCRINGISSPNPHNKHTLETPAQNGIEHHCDDVNREEDQNPAEEVSDPGSTGTRACPVGQSTRAVPGSLSEMCLRVELLKAQRPPATALRENTSDAPQSLQDNGSDGKGRERSEGSDSLPHSGQSSDEESPESSRSDDAGKDRASTPPLSPEHSHDFLDVSRAYAEDVLVLDVIQDDPELFGTVVSETGQKRDAPAEENGNANHCRIDAGLTADGAGDSLPTAADVKTDPTRDGDSLTVKQTQIARAPVQSVASAQSENGTDCNNNNKTRESNPLNGVTVLNTRSTRLVMDACSNGRETSAKEAPALRALHSSYCWFYFSEHNTCLRPVCWFLHTPRDGDEKFCMETVRKFCHSGKHLLVLRAVEVLVGYYSRCAPCVSFSQETVNSLLSSLLNAGLLREFESVINLLLTHKKLPPPEIVLAVFKVVRERGLSCSVPELIVLTSKMVEAGCVFSVDQCEVMQNHLQMMQVPRQQMDIFLAVKCRALAMNPHTLQLSDLAQAVVSVEMLKHQEDWAGLALVFCGVCVRPHSPGELLRFCCCVTMALLREPKDKLTLPYELFSQSVCQQEPSDEMIKTILGRIGVSLIFRYHRTREWNKGVKLVNVMFGLDIEFITLKGLMGNEHRVSRCQLVTMATELFLHSGSIEGALKMLRADDWFVSSSVWPCEASDVESRKRVLTLLAGKTSHRDTFEILTHLPGLEQPIDGVRIQDYTDMFCAHLRLCVLKQTLPVAADLLEFMLTQGMEPDTQQLQTLIHKLGKQNNWSRARALFRRARAAGFYSAVVCEADALFLPCSLSEIEMTLAFEMFITHTHSSTTTPAGASQPLLITLRRLGEQQQVSESEYLAAGCRLLSAALIPNPKLSIRYTSVSSSQEQLFSLDRAAAQKWFSQNQRWAQDVWPS